MVLTAGTDSFEQIVNYGLEPGIPNMYSLRILCDVLEKRGLKFSENDYLAALYSFTRKKVIQPELWATIKCSYEFRNKKERLDVIREKMSFKTVHKAGRKVSEQALPEEKEKREIAD